MRHLFVVLALFLSGCGVISTNPIHTAKDVLYDDALVGTWQTRGIPLFGWIEVSRWAPADDSYRIVLMDQNDKQQLGVVRANGVVAAEISLFRFSATKVTSAIRVSGTENFSVPTPFSPNTATPSATEK